MFPDLGRILLLSGYGGSRSRTRSEPPGSSPFVVNMRLITTNPGCLRGFHTTIFHHPLDEDNRHSADLYAFYLKNKQTNNQKTKQTVRFSSPTHFQPHFSLKQRSSRMCEGTISHIHCCASSSSLQVST